MSSSSIRWYGFDARQDLSFWQKGRSTSAALLKTKSVTCLINHDTICLFFCSFLSATTLVNRCIDRHAFLHVISSHPFVQIKTSQPIFRITMVYPPAFEFLFSSLLKSFKDWFAKGSCSQPSNFKQLSSEKSTYWYMYFVRLFFSQRRNRFSYLLTILICHKRKKTRTKVFCMAVRGVSISFIRRIYKGREGTFIGTARTVNWVSGVNRWACVRVIWW